MSNNNKSNNLKTISIKQLQCNRCQYVWWPRINRDGNTVIPKYCPNHPCKSPYWNKERVHNKQK